MTIDTNVAVDLDVAAMKAGDPDVEALRALFAELEFTSLLKEVLPVEEVEEGDYREIKSKAEFDEFVRTLTGSAPLAFAIPAADEADREAEEEKEPDWRRPVSWLSSRRIRATAPRRLQPTCDLQGGGNWCDRVI